MRLSIIYYFLIFSTCAAFGQTSRSRVVDSKLSSIYDVHVEYDSCDLKKNIYCSRLSKISIIKKNSSSPIKTIVANVRVAETLEHMVRFADFNFDGNDDLALRNIFLETTIYIYDSKQDVFNENADFTSISVGSKGIFPNNDRLIEVRHEADYYEDLIQYYQVDNNRPILIRELITTFADPINGEYSFTERFLAGSDWRTKTQTLKRPASDGWLIPGNGKVVEVKEEIKVTNNPHPFDITITLPTARAKGKKNTIGEGWYSYVKDKPAVIQISDKRITSETQKIFVKGVGQWLYDTDRSNDGKFEWAYEEQAWIKIQNLNFDDQPDLLVLSKLDENIKRYHCYIFNYVNKQFEYSSTFSGLYHRWSDLDVVSESPFVFYADGLKRTITLTWGDEYEGEVRTYQILNNTPRLVGLTKLANKLIVTAVFENGRWTRGDVKK